MSLQCCFNNRLYAIILILLLIRIENSIFFGVCTFFVKLGLVFTLLIEGWGGGEPNNKDPQ